MSIDKYIVGIDPGLTGAFVVQGSKFNIREIYDMPVVESPQGLKTPRKRNKKTGKMSGGNEKKIVDSRAVYDWLVQIRYRYNVRKAIIEAVVLMPRQSVNATASQVSSFQAVLSALQIAEFETNFIYPITWKRKRPFVGKGKSEPRKFLLKLLDTEGLEGVEYFLRVKDNDRADAFWIGRYYFDKKKEEK